MQLIRYDEDEFNAADEEIADMWDPELEVKTFSDPA